MLWEVDREFRVTYANDLVERRLSETRSGNCAINSWQVGMKSVLIAQ